MKSKTKPKTAKKNLKGKKIPAKAKKAGKKSGKSKKSKKVNKGGRPPIYKNNKELAAAIQNYFDNGMTKRKVVTGKGDAKEVVEIPIPTITGLCNFLGFESRQSFYDLEKDARYSYTIKRARLTIEQNYEENLSIGNYVGAIFALKNMGWYDKTISDVTVDAKKDVHVSVAGEDLDLKNE